MLLLRAALSIFFVEGPTLSTSPNLAKSQEVLAMFGAPGISEILTRISLLLLPRAAQMALRWWGLTPTFFGKHSLDQLPESHGV